MDMEWRTELSSDYLHMGGATKGPGCFVDFRIIVFLTLRFSVLYVKLGFILAKDGFVRMYWWLLYRPDLLQQEASSVMYNRPYAL